MNRTTVWLAAVVVLLGGAAHAADWWQVLADGDKSADKRLGSPRAYGNGYFPMTVPASKEAWEKRRQELREQLLVVNGLWPAPEKTPLNPVIHGKIDRDDYTVEKVYFASLPGHYVTGNLYRPKDHIPNRGRDGKRPGVLCPHGHWANGRFYEANAKEIENQRKIKAEQTDEGARYPLQARCAMLARLGCVVFHYDMVGNADSKVIGHRQGFTDAEAELRLQNFMGLQTWNSVRSLDFLLALPDVDARRIGVTGASGGGTQTFILCGIDDRPAVAFPAVMVSTDMQGGCICENCSSLRIGAGNIDFAALMAPRPLAMSGADDWTINIERKGLPELKAVYKLYGAEDKVEARCWPEFKHNYNQPAREMMYDWFNKHLALGFKSPVAEKPFTPIPPRELAVFDSAHPTPKDAARADELRKYLTRASDKQIDALVPRDARGLTAYRQVMGPALRVTTATSLPAAAAVEVKEVGEQIKKDGLIARRYLLGRKDSGEQVPALGLTTKEFDGTVIVWVHPQGKASLFQDGKLTPQAQRLLDRKAGILAIDVFQTGELRGDKTVVNKDYAGYTFGYNRTTLGNRVHDILTAVAFALSHEKTKVVHLAGFDEAGPWVMLARGLCGEAVKRTVADAHRFRFESVKEVGDEMLLPGGLKYGGLGAMAGLAAPAELWVFNTQGTGNGRWLKAAYESAGASGKFKHTPEKPAASDVVDWLTP